MHKKSRFRGDDNLRALKYICAHLFQYLQTYKTTYSHMRISRDLCKGSCNGVYVCMHCMSLHASR